MQNLLISLRIDLDEWTSRGSTLNEHITQLNQKNQQFEAQNKEMNAKIDDLEKKIKDCGSSRKKQEEALKNERVLVEDLMHKNNELKESTERERKIDLLVFELKDYYKIKRLI
jgi:chromosome segregation ATPase